MIVSEAACPLIINVLAAKGAYRNLGRHRSTLPRTLLTKTDAFYTRIVIISMVCATLSPTGNAVVVFSRLLTNLTPKTE